MEKTVKKLLVATGLIASAAVALLPLTSYARPMTEYEITGDMSFGAGANGTATWSSPNSDYQCDRWEPELTACARATQQTGGPTTVTVNVDTILAIDAVTLTCTGASDTCDNADDGSKVIQAYPGLVRTGTLTASVRSAKPFTISISAEDPYLKGQDATGDFTGYVIPSNGLIDGEHNGWGIQKSGETGYTGITTRPVVFLTSETPQDDFGNFNFEVGVSVNDSVPQGLYSTEVTVTAATIGTN